MAGSTINGNAGATNSGAIVYATPVDNRGGAISGAPTGINPTSKAPAQPAVVSAIGAYSFTNLAAGMYSLRLVPPAQNAAASANPLIQSQPITQSLITVDGSSTYAI